MPQYSRAYIAGGTFFFTVALLERKRDLLVANVDILRDAFRSVHRRYPFRIDAIVVLPDHLHAMWSLPAGDSDFSTRWRLIKTAFTRQIPATERLSAVRKRKGERGIRQRRFWEHAIRDEHDWERHVDYIHFNPVKHGHAKRAIDWPYSSLHRFVREGQYAVDWGGGNDLEIDGYE